MFKRLLLPLIAAVTLFIIYAPETLLADPPEHRELVSYCLAPDQVPWHFPNLRVKYGDIYWRADIKIINVSEESYTIEQQDLSNIIREALVKCFGRRPFDGPEPLCMKQAYYSGVSFCFNYPTDELVVYVSLVRII